MVCPCSKHVYLHLLILQETNRAAFDKQRHTFTRNKVVIIYKNVVSPEPSVTVGPSNVVRLEQVRGEVRAAQEPRVAEMAAVDGIVLSVDLALVLVHAIRAATLVVTAFDAALVRQVRMAVHVDRQILLRFGSVR